MIPEKLIISGIYSYQKKVEIDFEKLTAAGIFGIFGAVGSGKSTILEAISYAMYGKTERLNDRDSKLYNMMNLRSNEMEIDFIFRHQGEKYRFTANARRNSKNFEDISKSDRNAYQWKAGKWIPLESTDATHVTGLKYDHFKQIVIIPQGKFNEFVQLSPADRTKMLRELFPLDRFDLRNIVQRLHSEANIAITSLEGRLQELDEYKQENVEVLQNEIEGLRKSLQTLKLSLQKIEKERTQALELKGLVAELENIQQQFQELQSQKQTYDELKKHIEKYENTRLTFEHLLSRLKELDDETLQLTQNLKILSEQKDNLTKSKVENEKLVSMISESLGDEDNHKKEIAALEKVIKVKKIDTELNSVSQVVMRLDREKLAEEERIKTISEKTKNLKNKLTELKRSLLNETTLYQLQQSFADEDNLKLRLNNAKAELERVEKLINQLTEERTNIVSFIIEKIKTDKSAQDLKMSEAVELISIALQNIETQLTESELRRDDLSLKSHLAKHANELKVGEKCPLCGAIEHPEPYTDDKIFAEREALMSQIENQRKTKELFSHSLVQLNNLKVRFQQEGSAVNERRQQVETIQNEIEECLLKQKEIPMKLSRTELSKAIATLVDQKKSITNFEKEIELAEDKLSNQNALNNIKEKITENSKVQSQLNGQKIELLIDVNSDWLNYSIDQINVKLQQTNKSLTLLQKAKTELLEFEKQFERINTEIEQTEKIKSQAERKQLEINEQVKVNLGKQGFNNIEEVKLLLAEKIDLQKSKVEIEAFYKNLHLLESKLSELKKKLGVQTFDEEAFKQLIESFEALQIQISQLEEQVGALQSQLDDLKKKLTIKKSLKKELDALEKRKRNLDVLNSMFRGDGFVKFVSQIYLMQLCSIANERFKKLTYNQLSLDVDEKYNFIVRDYLNEGKTRLLKTLSGGQTFQAALSLAMALSEQIQHYQKVKQQFFFMDEGFGSLDKESLSLVFDTLKQLRKEDRTVGIISHVEELQTEIDSAIFVKNDPETGSVVHFAG